MRPSRGRMSHIAGFFGLWIALVGSLLSVAALYNRQTCNEPLICFIRNTPPQTAETKLTSGKGPTYENPTRELQTEAPVGDPQNAHDDSAAVNASTQSPILDNRLLAASDGIRMMTPAQMRRIEAVAAAWCHVTLSEVEARLLKDAQDGELKEFDLLTGAMIAGGCPPQKLEFLLRKFADQMKRIQARVDPRMPPLVRLQQAFRALHSEILYGGYHIGASNPGEAIQSGQFNCVSATILFKLVADSLGFEVRVLQSPTHAYCLVRCEDNWVPVECTCPTWFDNLSNRDQLAQDVDRQNFGKTLSNGNRLEHPMVSRAQQSEGAPDPKSGRGISETQLLGTIYYNRGVASLLDRQYEVAVVSNLRAIQLDPENQSAQDNLLASLNNWAIALAERREFAEAATRLMLALECRPDSGPIQANLYRVCREWKNELSVQGKDEEVKAQLGRVIESLSRHPCCTELRTKIGSLLTY